MSGRHGVAPRSRATAVLLALATAGGLWLGIRAADVSPVAAPAAVVQTPTATPAAPDGPGPRVDRGGDGRRGGAGAGGPGRGGGR